VHGSAALAIVLEGNALTIELDSPLYNLMGFERAPETDEQVAALEAAEAALSQPGELFTLNAEAGCTPPTEEMDVHVMEGDHHGEHHDDHGHDEHAEHDEDGPHDDHESHGDHDGHDAEHDEHDEAHSEHSDVVISYEFTCESPDELRTFSTSMFDSFSNMTELEVVFLGPNTQKGFELTPAYAEAQLRE